MRLASAFISSTIASIGVSTVLPAMADSTTTLVLTDVTGIVPETLQQAQERCAKYPVFLAFEASKATTQQKKAYWETTIACMVADNNAVNNAFLSKASTVSRSNTNALIATAQATMLLGQLQRQPDGKVMLASLSSTVVVGGNDTFIDQNGKRQSYATPWGKFRILGQYTPRQMQEDYVNVGAIYLGEIRAVPFRNAPKTLATGLYFHDWFGQEKDSAIFTNAHRAISHSCIRVPATFLKNMMEVLTTDSAVYIGKTIPPLEAFPLDKGAQR